MLNEILKALQKNIKDDARDNVAQNIENVAQNIENVAQNASLSLDEKIIQIINLNSKAKRDEIASLLLVNKKTIERHLKALGIYWDGHPKTGHWVLPNKI